MNMTRDHSHDHSHDLLTWSWPMTHKSQPGIWKLTWHQAIIDIHIRVTTTSTSWLYPDLFITAARVFSKSRNLARALSRALLRPTKEDYLQVNAPFPESSGGSLRGVPSRYKGKATGGSHSEWWAGRLAGRSISLTLEDVNVSFNLHHTTRWVGVTAE